jgi:tripartite-type tricarboxylate transporter receptor subunit TctC
LADVIPGFDLTTLIGVFARSGTAPAVVEKVAAEVVAIVRQPDAAPQLALGMQPAGADPRSFGQAVADEIARVTKVVQNAGIKPE